MSLDAERLATVEVSNRPIGWDADDWDFVCELVRQRAALLEALEAATAHLELLADTGAPMPPVVVNAHAALALARGAS